MCRGGKDGKTIRCKVKKQQIAHANLRKQIKYRADKEQLTVEEWKTTNPEEVLKLTARAMPTLSRVSFQPISAGRKLPEGIPVKINDHIQMSKVHLDSILSPEEYKALAGYTSFAGTVTNPVLLSGKIEEHSLSPDALPWKDSSSVSRFATKEDLIDYMETMDQVLSKRNEQKIVYRGIPIYTELHEEIEKAAGKEIDVADTEELLNALGNYYSPGKVIDFPTYVSTTHSALYAAERSEEHDGSRIGYYDKPEVKGIVFEMKTNAGLDVTAAARHNSYEREVVLPRDTRFRVESITLRPESYDTISGYDHLDYPEDLEALNFTRLAVVVQMVEVDKEGNEITHTEPHKPSPLNL